MTNIKFRAWDKKRKIMCCVYGLSWDATGRLYQAELFYCSHCNYKTVLIEDLILMQYIGFFDKKGSEIYEGDMVVFDSTEIGGEKITGEVFFNTERALAGLEWGIWTDKGYYKTDFLGQIEVVGNVYERQNRIDKQKQKNMIQRMQHYQYYLHNRNWDKIVKIIWDKINEIIDHMNERTNI